MVERNISKISEQLAQELVTLRESDAFDYLVNVAPVTIPIVEDLTHKLAVNRQNTHAAFWLMYLRSYNLLALGIRQDLDRERLVNNIHLNAVREWISEEVRGGIENSARDKFFENKEAQDFLETLLSLEMTDVCEYESVILEIPGRITQLSEKAVA